MIIEVVKIIGRGGFATVYHAKDCQGKDVAVKVFNKKIFNEKDALIPFREDALLRFKHEASIMSSLFCPYTPKIYDYTEYEGQPSIVMELIHGVDLFRAIHELKWNFNTNELKVLWNRIVSALYYIHSKNVVHCDISPRNIILTHLGNIKLIDFGISDSPMNGKNVFVDFTWGTREFMSPEQVMYPNQVDYRTDYYSLARTFLYLLTGNSPRNNGWEVGQGGLSDYCTAPDTVFRGHICKCAENFDRCPEDWNLFLKPYLAKDPNQRPRLITTWH